MDLLDNLPIDNTKRPSVQESEVLDRFFKPSPKSQKYSEFKVVAIASILYLVLSIDYFDKFVDMLPHTGSPLFKYGIKALIFFSVLYVLVIMTS